MNAKTMFDPTHSWLSRTWCVLGCVCVCLSAWLQVPRRLVDHGPGRPTSGWPWAIWKYDCNPCEDLAWVSITTVICHTGIQYSFHVQVKPLFLSASPITMGERGRESGGGNPVKVLAWLGRERERDKGRRGWNWESTASIKPLGPGWRNLSWNTRSH